MQPFPLFKVYGLRLLGVGIQGIVHLLLVGIVLAVGASVAGHGSLKHLAMWLAAALITFVGWAALCTAVSVYVMRDHNTILLIITIVILSVLRGSLENFMPGRWETWLLATTMTWLLPPSIGLFESIEGLRNSDHLVFHVMQGVLVAIVYTLAGMAAITRREFPHTGS